jgi:hypothetical protein
VDFAAAEGLPIAWFAAASLIGIVSYSTTNLKDSRSHFFSNRGLRKSFSRDI